MTPTQTMHYFLGNPLRFTIDLHQIWSPRKLGPIEWSQDKIHCASSNLPSSEKWFATGVTGYHPCCAKIPSWYHCALQHDTAHGLQEQTSGKLMIDDDAAADAADADEVDCKSLKSRSTGEMVTQPLGIHIIGPTHVCPYYGGGDCGDHHDDLYLDRYFNSNWILLCMFILVKDISVCNI